MIDDDDDEPMKTLENKFQKAKIPLVIRAYGTFYH